MASLEAILSAVEAQVSEIKDGDDVEPDGTISNNGESQEVVGDREDTTDAAQNNDGGEFAENAFSIHLKRQAQLCKLALQAKYKYLPESVSKIGAAFEDFIFNPKSKVDKEQQETRLNFYPPFAVPEVTANYFSFFNILSVPFSCCANRTGTEKLRKVREVTKFDYLPQFDSDMFTVTESLGSEVTATDSLPRRTRLVTLDADYARLLYIKQKLDHVTQFAYPALNLPPKIHKCIVENLFKVYQTGEETEEVDYVFTDEKIAAILSCKVPDLKLTEKDMSDLGCAFRKDLMKAIQFLTPLKLMEQFFRNPGQVKKLQEILHYTFNHGFIKLITHVTGQCLSKFITFHGMTFENRNNNPNLQATFDLNDGEDYMVDSIFLFLMLNWQTAMGIWQQNLNVQNMGQLETLLKAKREELVFCRNADSMANLIANWISDEGALITILQQGLPDFVSQTQLNNYRTFILSRSNITCLPVMVKDFVPIDFKESSPRLWSHVYLLRLSYFFYNHGDYMQIFFINDEKPLENEVLCNCNLCSPHRTPLYNSALHNEILAIDTFDFYVPGKDGKEGQRVTLSAGMWANKFLDHFEKEDFFPFEVIKYLDSSEKFTKTPSACCITKPEILSTLRMMQKKREQFLLEKGSGTYLDPTTGDKLSDAKLSLQPQHSSRNNSTKGRKTN